jgi:branched-chain amino acid transport system ATP-binding protein
MLLVKGLVVYYGVAQALKGISLSVNEGQIVSLIGANGAGKTTTLRTLSGLIKPSQGTIEFLGENIAGASTEKIVKKGIIHVPEGRRVFPAMTVLENLEMGAFTRNVEGSKKNLQSVYELFPRLRERVRQKAGTLSGGEQQMLAIGRGLMAQPKCLLLDEPSMGLAPIIVEEIFQRIAMLNRERKIPFLLVEQNAVAALEVAHHGYVLETGEIVLEGDSASLAQNDLVKKAYLGIRKA